MNPISNKFASNWRASIILLGLFASQLHGADALHLMIGVDLTQTERAIGNSGRSEFDENLDAVASILNNMPAASKLEIFGITDKTSVAPFPIMGATLNPDPGYRNRRLQAARNQLVAQWRTRTRSLSSKFPHTDVLGSFDHAAESFRSSDALRRRLVIVSDARNEIPGILDLEKPKTIAVNDTINALERRGLIVDLAGVEVFFLGVGAHRTEKPPEYFLTLRQFWRDYVRRSKGNLRGFSPGRPADAIRMITSVSSEGGG